MDYLHVQVDNPWYNYYITSRLQDKIRSYFSTIAYVDVKKMCHIAADNSFEDPKHMFTLMNKKKQQHNFMLNGFAFTGHIYLVFVDAE